ncbi:unnamed protein product [Clonostachys chloroleuca]|uniref:DNA ligase ATP-dependent N-terminal domain-containing protein n=1 Tax=Clonostachys chloroleuca TaxID=1926264 RepID=A0AA35PVR2_9HYPO|nr:unnamed protein product [Clonostachys chloroleuca]
MPFPFTLLCDLLNRLERNHKPSSVDRTREIHARTVVSWFNKHNEAIPRRGSEAIAFSSCLCAERGPDRVFSLPTRQLEKMIERAQCLGSSRMGDLQRWKANDGPDFASCVEHVMIITECEPRPGPNVLWTRLTRSSIRSLPPHHSYLTLKERIKDKYGQSIQRDSLLLRLFRRLRSSEVKWMIRMLSKNYSPAQVPEKLAMSEFHFLLPDLLRSQSTIHAAVDFLGASTIRCMPIQPAANTRDGLREAARWELKPQTIDRIGIHRPLPGRKLQPAELFKHPFMVEVGRWLRQARECGYFTLRFPRVLKVHEVRSFKDVVSFAELQEIATKCQGKPDDLQKEEESWLRRLRTSFRSPKRKMGPDNLAGSSILKRAKQD